MNYPQRLALLALILFCLVYPQSGTAQASSSPAQLRAEPLDNDDTPFVDENAYPQVYLDLTPTNEVGVPLTGLSANDFAVLESGHLVQNLNFEAEIDSDRSVSVLLILDISNAMTDEWVGVRNGVTQLYEALEANDESGLLAFKLKQDGTGVNLDTPFPQIDPSQELTFTSDEGALINLLNGLSIAETPETPIYDALYKGIRLMAMQAHYSRRAIILITNGADWDVQKQVPVSLITNGDFVIDEAREFDVPIFTIGLGDAVDAAFLQRAALLTGGTYNPLPVNGLRGADLIQIVQILKQIYHLNFVAQTPSDNALHPLDISVNSTMGTATANLFFRALPPVEPLISAIRIESDQTITKPLTATIPISTPVTIVPVISSRYPIRTVRYYIDDNNTAIATTTTYPWAFLLDIQSLTPNQFHTLAIEVIDSSDPSQVITQEVNIWPTLCNFFCRLGWPPWLQRSAIVALLFTFTLASWRIWAYRQQRARQIALEATPIALVPNLNREESPIPSTPPRPYKPLPTGSDQPVTEIDPLTRDTDLYLHPVIGVAKLIHLSTKREYPLMERLKIGQSQESDIQLEGSGVDLHHAEVYWQTTQYVLVNLSKVYSTQLNSQPVTVKPLSDSDRILIGDHTLVFKFQE